ncbi:hypothetical protein EPUS_07422 [Endocarpon pusillum Z07020]|uniref:Nrap protein domain-containing protein n=1 Tax=Endocarpon pusillum (strain Z07020 / HMAS-L-300199) TaxID=1263415 RepID=U1HQM3_ENDPU|nr:uncharacterized protein EPUS_07422 [Endocarpon pusillum Z07020]ERF71394.1 hypothetical protein EPUS_07422 [Endocarpon pusillum Z07020]
MHRFESGNLHASQLNSPHNKHATRGARLSSAKAKIQIYFLSELFKAILQFLAAKDLTDPLLLNGATCEIPKSDAPVLFDGAGQINLLFKMTCWSYQLLRQEARATIEAFSSKAVDIFESIFVKRLDQDCIQGAFEDEPQLGGILQSNTYPDEVSIDSELSSPIKLVVMGQDDGCMLVQKEVKSSLGDRWGEAWDS